MPTLEYVSMFMNEHCEDVKEKNGKFHCRCPLCGDSKKSKRKKRFHLTFFSEDKIIYNCFNCNASGTFTDLYATLKGIDENTAYKELHGFESVSNRFKKVKFIKPKVEDDVIDFRKVLKNCICENTNENGYVTNNVIKILKKFKKERDVPDYIKLWFCIDGDYKNRIILPIYDDKGRMIYFQARATLPKQKPKYLNPTSTKKLIIPNIERLDFNKPIVITEGLLDSFSISNGTTCLGKSITVEFIKELKKHNEDTALILVFDNDEPGIEARAKFLRENDYNKVVKYFLWNKRFPNIKDLNQMKTENNLSIKEMDNIIKENSYNFFDFMVIKNL
jgi:DNA primase